MSMLSLETLWYIVVIASLIFYAVLDGFDLGVGCLHLCSYKDEERRVFLNAIGPVWDGNEVWIVVIGGALFAGFPNVFATLFSAFYNFTMLLLFGLIFRAVAIEFRSKHDSYKWRRNWDIAFSLASYIIAFGCGLVLGNLIEGIPLDKNKDFVGTTFGFLKPYSLLVGLTSVSLFAMHGAIYLVMKTEKTLHNHMRKWAKRCIVLFIISDFALTLATFYIAPHMLNRLFDHPLLFLIPLFGFLSILIIPTLLKKHYDGYAFIASSLGIALFLILFAVSLFPTMIRSSIAPETNSLSVYNSSSSPLTLKVLLIIVLIGIPLVLAYGFYIYRIFRGKVRLEKTSY